MAGNAQVILKIALRGAVSTEKLRSASRKESRIARTVVVKLKTSEFKILTRSHTPGSPPSSYEELTDIALKLRERVDLSRSNAIASLGLV